MTRYALGEAINYLESVVNHFYTPVIFCDRFLKISKVNTAAQILTGYKNKEIKGKKLSLMFLPKNRKTLEAKVKAILRKNNGKEIEIDLLRKDSVIKNTLWNLVSLYKDKKQLIATIVYIQDITGQKTLENKLRQSEALFRILGDSSPLAIYLAEGVEQKAEYLNPRFTQLFGYTLKDVPTAGHWFSLAYPDPKYRKEIVDEWMRRIIKANMTGKPIRPMEAQATCKDGSKKDILWSFVSHGNKNISYGLDLTERKRLETRKDDFINIASHEFKTPLTSLKAYSQFLKKNHKTDTAGDLKILNRMEVQINKLVELSNEMLDASKIQTGKLYLDKEKINIDKLIEGMISDISMIANSDTESVKDPYRFIFKNKANIRIEGDKYRLSQVINNLLTNAVKYSGRSRRIIVKTQKVPGGICVSVRDHGIGIPKNKQKHLFERFFQANKQTGWRGRFASLGLGLYISSNIVKQHKGRMWVKSTEGKGSVFYFFLPLK